VNPADLDRVEFKDAAVRKRLAPEPSMERLKERTVEVGVSSPGVFLEVCGDVDLCSYVHT